MGVFDQMGWLLGAWSGARCGRLRSKAGQVPCPQVLARDRHMAAERAAHGREVQALRMQCDELGARLMAERQGTRIDVDQHRLACEARDRLRQEVAKLLDLLEQSDTAQAALQHRANALEQQMLLGQRQLEVARRALERERRVYPARLPPGVQDRRVAA